MLWKKSGEDFVYDGTQPQCLLIVLYNFVLLYGFILVMPNMVCIKLKDPRLATAIPMYIVT